MEENTKDKQGEQDSTDMDGQENPIVTHGQHTPVAWHTFALELRGAEQKSTAGELFDLSACVSLMHHVETNQQNLGTRT